MDESLFYSPEQQDFPPQLQLLKAFLALRPEDPHVGDIILRHSLFKPGSVNAFYEAYEKLHRRLEKDVVDFRGQYEYPSFDNDFIPDFIYEVRISKSYFPRGVIRKNMPKDESERIVAGLFVGFLLGYELGGIENKERFMDKIISNLGDKLRLRVKNPLVQSFITRLVECGSQYWEDIRNPEKDLDEEALDKYSVIQEVSDIVTHFLNGEEL